MPDAWHMSSPDAAAIPLGQCYYYPQVKKLCSELGKTLVQYYSAELSGSGGKASLWWVTLPLVHTLKEGLGGLTFRAFLKASQGFLCLICSVW